MAIRFVLNGIRRRVDDRQALALLGLLERRASDTALHLAQSLSRALASGAATEIVLGEKDRGELRRVLEDWGSEGELPDEVRWLRMGLHGERLPWELPRREE